MFLFLIIRSYWLVVTPTQFTPARACCDTMVSQRDLQCSTPGRSTKLIGAEKILKSELRATFPWIPWPFPGFGIDIIYGTGTWKPNKDDPNVGNLFQSHGWFGNRQIGGVASLVLEFQGLSIPHSTCLTSPCRWMLEVTCSGCGSLRHSRASPVFSTSAGC